MTSSTARTAPCAAELAAGGLVAIIRLRTAAPILDVVRAIAAGGILAVEITLNTPDALELLRTVAADKPAGLRLGAGTVLDAAEARQAQEAGAEFIVTPTLQPDTIRVSRDAGLPVFCGCWTPTEMLAAHRAGADFIKLFPATAAGAETARAVRAALPFLKLFPTGGITSHNLPDWLAAGCTGAEVGSAVVDDDRVQRAAWAEITSAARVFRAIVDRARKP